MLTACSFTYWVYVNLLPWPSRWFVSRHLELSEMPFDPVGSRKEVERFVSSYLKADGVFILRMITMHSGIIFGTDLVLSLWRSFYGIEEKVRRSNSEETPKVPQTADENKLNALRLRFKKKATFKKSGNKDNDGDDDDDDDQSLKEVFIPANIPFNEHASRLPLNSLKNTTLSSLDMPDSKATTLEAKSVRRNSDDQASTKQNKKSSLKLLIPDRM